nr:hypothetical protein [Candidatus Sigynarchaeota archaeon]
MTLITTLLFIVVVLLWIASQAHGFTVMLAITSYTEFWDVFAITDMIRVLKRKERFWMPGLTWQKHKAIATVTALCAIVTCPLFISVPWIAPLTPIQFNISAGQAQAYDLVLYYPGPDWINASVCQIAQDYNVTLSFNMVQNEFNASNPRSGVIANAVRVCNTYNVSVEVWPLFLWDEGSYPSLSEADRFPGLYAAFHEWTERENITVKYIMWDIEAGGESSTCTSPSWVDSLGIFGYTGRSVQCLADTDATWDAAVATIRQVHQQAKLDGFLVRATTHASLVYDMFDGDDSLQRNWRLPVWTTGEYEYVSQMLYRGCDGPGNRSSAFIYEEVRASALTVPGPTAVCLGCINYEPYPDSQSVADDVRLALAAGADSIRLFQGLSWVFGTGEAPGTPDSLAWTNPPHYLAGLEELLVQCREGGSITFYPERSDKIDMIVNILVDVFADFVFP